METIKSISTLVIDGDWIESKDQSIDGIRLVQTGNVGIGKYLDKSDRAKYISEETFERLNCTELTAGDVLVSRLPDPIGRSCVVPNNIGRAITAVDCTIIRLDSKRCDKEYFVYYTQSNLYNNRLAQFFAGTTRTRISRKNLEKIEVPLPNLDEQKQIALILGKVDTLSSLRKQQLAKLDELVKARFVELFGDIGTDTKGWGLKRLGGCCTINPKKSEDKRLHQNLMVSFVPMPAVSENGEIDASETKSYDEVKTGFTYFAEQDVLFAKITPCMENGKGAVAKGLCNGIGFGSTEFHVLRPVEGVSNPYWIYTVTAFEQFRVDAANNMTGSAGQRRVPASFLDAYKVTLPPIELQNQFASFVKQTDKSKLAIQQSLEKLETLKKALMQKYFE